MARSTNNNRRALTRRELEALADREAKLLVGESAERAFEMLDRGELKNTPATQELRMLRRLLQTA